MSISGARHLLINVEKHLLLCIYLWCQISHLCVVFAEKRRSWSVFRISVDAWASGNMCLPCIALVQIEVSPIEASGFQNPKPWHVFPDWLMGILDPYNGILWIPI